MVYRPHNPRWAFAPSSGDGAASHGGRLNPRGTPVLYSSLDPKTASMEAQQGAAVQGATKLWSAIACAASRSSTSRIRPYLPPVESMTPRWPVPGKSWPRVAECRRAGRSLGH
ncbi:RES domain-containing protein [Thiocapsa sp.]|uniref:RES domain-containing protein n=1 Tax=Thiocapsa sp. TaxID=2024551 RepID=UPI003593BEC2